MRFGRGPARSGRFVVFGVVSMLVVTVLTVAGRDTAIATPSPVNLVAHWSFDQASGTVLTDSSGNGRNGTLVNSPKWVAGRLNNALSFTTNKYVSVGNISAVNGASKLTMSAWIKRGSSNAKVLLGKQVNNHDITIEAWNDGYVHFQLSNGSDASGKIQLNDTSWHHVAVTFDGTKSGNTNRLKGYVDGVQRSLTFKGTIPATTTSNTTPFNVGKIGSDSSNGLVDDVWIYNRTLTSAEIADLASTVGDTSAPSVPTALSATALSSSEVRLSWAAATDNVGVTGYRIYRNGTQIGTSSSTSYQNPGLNGATTYSYTVVAYDAAGNASAQSAAVSVTTPAPAPPPAVVLTSDVTTVDIGGAASLQWSSANATSCTASGGWSGARPLSGIQAVVDIRATTTYSLTCSGAGGQASSSVTVTAVDITAPSVPGGVVATAVSTTQINVMWTASTDNAAATGYRVYRDGSQIATVGATSYQNAGLSPDTTYTYTVVAYDAAGNESAASDVAVATTPAADTNPPSVPTDLTATSTGASTIGLVWDPSFDAVGVAGYQVFRGSTQIGTVTGAAYQDSGLVPDTTYTYTVRAYDAAGNTSGQSGSASATTEPTTSGFSFPIRISADKRRFEDSTGKPFLMQGDAAWSLIAQLNKADVTTYLNDREAKGFNTLLVNVLEHKFATNAPRNIYGVGPFTTPGDYSTPNEAYFANVDWVIQQAAAHGMVVLLAPSYAGYEGGDQGWYQEMVANGTTKLRNYGRFLGQRYGDYSNIIWVQAADYNPPNRSLVDAIAEGILETDPDALQTAHGAPESNVADYWSGHTWMAINQVYTYSETFTKSVAQYQRTPVMPFIMVESNYENGYGITTATLRAQAYRPLLAGAAGQIFGNHPVWHFSGPGIVGVPRTWQQELSSPGAVSMKFLGKLFNSRLWYQLVPDTGHTTLTAGYGSGNSSAPAARTSTGGTVIVYTPSQRALTINMTRISGAQANAWWFNPANGVATSAGTFATTGSRVFTPPSSGDSVLVIDDASLGFTAPGQ